MSEQEFNKIFSQNLTYYLEQYAKSQADLAKYIGVSTASVSNWCKGIKLPRMDKVDKICKFFHINRSDLMEEKTEDSHQDTLTIKDKRDIKRDVDNIMEKLTSKEYGPAAYDGQELSPESAELFQEELEIALKRLKLINKEKYNPNKNKK